MVMCHYHTYTFDDIKSSILRQTPYRNSFEEYFGYCKEDGTKYATSSLGMIWFIIPHMTRGLGM